jgi:hypothetical protein
MISGINGISQRSAVDICWEHKQTLILPQKQDPFQRDKINTSTSLTACLPLYSTRRKQRQS